MIRYSNILCPTDFSEHSDAALARAEDLARRLDASLVLVHVVEPMMVPVEYGLPPTVVVGYADAATESARRFLETTAKAVEARGLRARVVVTSGRASDKICDVVQREGIDLVVMATHGRTGLKHALLGSTAERLVRTCPCPVLTVKAAVPAQQAGRASRAAPQPAAARPL